MRWAMVALGAAMLVLGLADMLAFHDLFEPHAARDWMMLAATLLLVMGVAGIVIVWVRERRPTGPVAPHD